ncbi:kinase D-interacting substrate of 220 kDa B-like isoform X3 [Dreissena polymorpha]|uniref:kinase D-interacting substrate of 220 kDa B-like isoform X3 n=1 Tax=Dreissena polymorpha TaxID=45954 RepID=UPI0022654559|nr:kinase D-interacting substrate of 220 kDa B-like isoform X3 [Dreissena polymorpha]
MALAQNNLRSQMLWENIRRGDLSNVRTLLQNKTINLEERDDSGQTFLMLACQKGEISLVRELLEAGIDPNAKDNDNWTALTYAAKDGYLEICIELLEKGAHVEHRDMYYWTALMWASYKGRTEVVQELLDRGADPNIKAEHNMSCLCWAAGRGHLEVVRSLVEKGAKVNSTDKYGTTPLIWACRKGHAEIVKILLESGALVDNTGMDSLTAVLVATKGGYTEVVQSLLEHNPNVAGVDKDGFTALMIAAKEGYEDIVQELLAKEAYVNVADRAGDTILIHAVKGGYHGIVRALLNRFADVDVSGTDHKTALYWAAEKGHADIVKLLLGNDADMEISTKDGDTPLMRAVRSRYELIVRLLLDKGAKVGVFDKKGDTALHISLRARSKRITELLLRNPRNSRLLYRPNKSGETPYNIDAYHQKSILTQIHGHRQLNASDGENLLGYEIYSSSLADILSDPSLNTPITVGLYAKWGSGKSFLINKLQSEMKSFTKANDENQLEFTWSLFIFLLIMNSIVGSLLALTVMYQVGLGVGFGLFVFEYGFLGLIWLCSTRYNVKFAARISQEIGKRLQILALPLQVLFCNPVKRSSSKDQPLVKFLFSESTKLNSVGGEKALGAMVAGLSESVEKEYGMLASRIFTVLKHSTDNVHDDPETYIGRFKTLCCIPLFVLVVFVLLSLVTGVTLLMTYKFENKAANGLMIGFACIVGGSVFLNIHNFGKAVISFSIPQKRRIMKAASNVHRIKIDGFMQVLKREVALMNNFVEMVDNFTKNTTRLVVVVDGLDSCEQEKVLHVLDIIHALFNEDNSCFVVVLAVDPQIIIKGIDQNLKSVFHDTNVNGFDYLRNIVHLPFYLQSQGIQVKRQELAKSISTYDVGYESPQHNQKAYRHKDSTVSKVSGFSLFEPPVYQHQESMISQISGITVIDQLPKRARSRPRENSITQATHSSFDISNTLTKNDYFSDINPKSMRRLMNIVAVTGRLLRAYNIDFNWYRLAAWVNVVEQWPYRLSWIIMYFEENDDLSDDTTLRFIYEKIEHEIPSSSDVEPLIEIDRNIRKLQAILSSKSTSSPMLAIADLKKFLPCTINLDPYLRKLIRSFRSHHADMNPALFTPTSNGRPGGPASKPDSGDLSKYRAGANWPGMKPPMVTSPGGNMMNYQPMMYPPYMAMSPQPYMMNMQGMGMQFMGTEDAGVKKSTHPGQLIAGFKDKEKLSKMSTEEVSTLLERINGLNHRLLSQYQQAVVENNINGLVLTQCGLDELGKCLQMKFGDWQLFRSAISSLRERELDINDDDDFEGIPSPISRTVSMSSRSIHFSKSDKSTSDMNDIQSSSQTPQSDSSKEAEPVVGFDPILEEDEDTKSRGSTDMSSLGGTLPKGMKRNDSMVAEALYESGLLHDFMQNFTENISEGDEDGLSNTEECSFNNSNSNYQEEQTTSSVMFSLSDVSNQQQDDHEGHTDDNLSTEFEPLLQSTDIDPLVIPRKSPIPILKFTKQDTVESKTMSDTNLENYNLRHDFMIVPTLSSADSTSSGGFVAEADFTQQASLDLDHSGLDERLLLVNETLDPKGKDSSKKLSLQESISQFTLERARQPRVEDSSLWSFGGAGSFETTSSSAQLITKKDKKWGEKESESFV